MEPLDHRTLVSQLVDDLNWLEAYSRHAPESADKTGPLRLAAALVRNVLGPFLEGQPPLPLHVVVVGGAGAGKSTIVNFLCGANVAEANPQAGFTRHPIAYVGGNAATSLQWSAHFGFLGPLQKLTQPAASNLDQDVYQVRRVPTASSSSLTATPAAPQALATLEPPTQLLPGLLDEFVVWDCPDMTTWASSGYTSRLLEVAGLADIIVYVASDERYNDAIPTQYLHLLIQSGKAVIVVLTKMRESDMQPLLEHFRQEVIARLPRLPDGSAPVVPCLAIPFLAPGDLADPTGKAAKYRIALLNQVMVLGDPPLAARQRTVGLAIKCLIAACSELLEVARQDLEAIDAWRAAVRAGRAEFEARYRREYLSSERFGRFDLAREHLLDLLELPGAGRIVSGLFWLARAPYRLVRSAITGMNRPESVYLPEQEVLVAAFRAWLDQLRSEALQRAGQHAVWKHLAKGFEGPLTQEAHDRFAQLARQFERGQAETLQGAPRSVYEGLESNPTLLNTLRSGKLALDASAIGAALWIANFSWWSLLAVPLAASFTHSVVEMIGSQVVEHKREQVRSRQQKQMSQSLATPLADWLCHWPVTGGSTYERLQLALQRIPSAFRQMEDALRRRL